MDAFLTRYFDEARRWIGDPAAAKRWTDAQKLEDFYQVERNAWESILQAAGQESTPGRSEALVTLVDNTEYYQLPGNFRQFLSLDRYEQQNATLLTVTNGAYDDTGDAEGEKSVTLSGAFADYVWVTGDEFVITSPTANAGTYEIAGPGGTTPSDTILLSTGLGSDETVTGTVVRAGDNRDLKIDKMRSIAEYSPGPGVLIMSEQRGMVVRPFPSLDANQAWTLTYQKGPVRLHRGTAQAVSANTLTGTSAVPTDGGEFITRDGYYVGSMIHVYSATTGEQQVREVTAYHGGSKKFAIRHPWSPIPTGTVLYEIRPIIPVEYDKLYALDAAIMHSPTRRDSLHRELKRERSKLWWSVLGYFLRNVADRGPARTLPVDLSEDDPYDYTGYDFTGY